MRHTATGWWLEEAGTVEPTAPLAGDTTADVVVAGGGYLGLWTAWHVLELAPEADVVLLEAGLCGHGPSGRNGGFVQTLWGDLPGLRQAFGEGRALAIGHASADSVRAIGDWCRANDIDAWFGPAPQVDVASSSAQDGAWHPVLAAARELDLGDEVRELSAADVRRICDSPVFRGGVRYATAATVQPARLALGLRRRLLERGVRIHERSPVNAISDDAVAETEGGRVRAGAAVLAVNASTAAWPDFGTALAVASSHIVLTEPVPDVLDELSWTNGEAIADCRTLVHYFRTTRDGRIAFGWGGGTMGLGGARARRLEVDPAAIATARARLVQFFPQLDGRTVTHAWGGPIDVSPTHVPVFGSRGRVHHGYGFTGNGVGPSELGGRILARLALDRRDEISGLALVEPGRKRFPPEPFRYAGGSLIRRALVRKDALEDDGRDPDPLTSLVASLPRRLGLHLPR